MASSPITSWQIDGERVPDELWTEVHDIVQDKGSRPFPGKRKQKGCLRRHYK